MNFLLPTFAKPLPVAAVPASAATFPLFPGPGYRDGDIFTRRPASLRAFATLTWNRDQTTYTSNDQVVFSTGAGAGTSSVVSWGDSRKATNTVPAEVADSKTIVAWKLKRTSFLQALGNPFFKH